MISEGIPLSGHRMVTLAPQPNLFVPDPSKRVVPFMRDVFTVPKSTREKPRLIGSVCTECEEYFFPKTGVKATCDNPFCPRSTKETLLSGRGKLLSATVTRSPAENEERASAVILLEEGIKINSHLVGWEGFRDLLVPGTSVELVLQEIEENDEGATVVGYAFKLVTGRRKPKFPEPGEKGSEGPESAKTGLSKAEERKAERAAAKARAAEKKLAAKEAAAKKAAERKAKALAQKEAAAVKKAKALARKKAAAKKAAAARKAKALARKKAAAKKAAAARKAKALARKKAAQKRKDAKRRAAKKKAAKRRLPKAARGKTRGRPGLSKGKARKSVKKNAARKKPAKKTSKSSAIKRAGKKSLKRTSRKKKVVRRKR